MIEKVAIALDNAEKEWYKNNKGFSASIRENLTKVLAKAAIEAMRDINYDLMLALEYDGYSAMIDAALKEE